MKNPSLAQLIYLQTQLEKKRLTQFHIGFEVGLVYCGNHKDISDYTAAIITSDNYLNMKS